MGNVKRSQHMPGTGRLIGLGLVLAVVLGAIIAVPAFASAAESGTSVEARAASFVREGEDGEQAGKGRKGHRGGRGMIVVASTAELTGTDHSDVIAALRDGSSLASYAAGFGVTEDELVTAIVLNAEAKLAERVSNGDMTQEEADGRIATLQEKVTGIVNTEGLGPKHNRGARDVTPEATS